MIWTNTKKARCRRIVEACAQASSIGFGLTALVPAVGTVAALIAGLVSGTDWLAAAAGGVMAISVIGAMCALGPLREPIRRLFWGVRFPRVTVKTVLNANGLYLREVTYEMKIVRTGLRRFADRYCCPGPTRGIASNEIDRPCLTPSLPHAPRVTQGGASILGPSWDTAEDCWHFLVDFGSPLSSGTDRTISIQQTIDWSHLDYLPRIQRTVLDPTDKLELRLQFTDVAWPSESWGEELISTRKARDLRVKRDAEHKELILIISRPRLGRTYRIRWSESKIALGPPDLASIEPHEATVRDQRHSAEGPVRYDREHSNSSAETQPPTIRSRLGGLRASPLWSTVVLRGDRRFDGKARVERDRTG